MLLQLNEEDAGKFAVVIWRMWKERNSKLWHGCCVPAQTCVSLGVNYLDEYAMIRERLMVDNISILHCKAWHRPPPSFIKANIDAAFFSDSREIGFGCILHDGWGNHLFSRTHVMPGSYSPEESEAIGLHEALSWIKDLGITRVIIEMDAKIVVDAVNDSFSDNSILGDIIIGVRRELLISPSYLVR